MTVDKFGRTLFDSKFEESKDEPILQMTPILQDLNYLLILQFYGSQLQNGNYLIFDILKEYKFPLEEGTIKSVKINSGLIISINGKYTVNNSKIIGTILKMDDKLTFTAPTGVMNGKGNPYFVEFIIECKSNVVSK